MTAGPVTGADGPSAAQTTESSDEVGTDPQTTDPETRDPQTPDPQTPAPGDEPPRPWLSLLRRVPGWVPALAVYLAVAIFMWWHVWGGGHPASTMLCNCGDPSSFAWFMEWPAYALTHGQSLFLEHHAGHVDGDHEEMAVGPQMDLDARRRSTRPNAS